MEAAGSRVAWSTPTFLVGASDLIVVARLTSSADQTVELPYGALVEIRKLRVLVFEVDGDPVKGTLTRRTLTLRQTVETATPVDGGGQLVTTFEHVKPAAGTTYVLFLFAASGADGGRPWALTGDGAVAELGLDGSLRFLVTDGYARELGDRKPPLAAGRSPLGASFDLDLAAVRQIVAENPPNPRKLGPIVRP